MTQTKKKKNLVIVRAGENSLHESWLPTSPDGRNWDMLVSSFCAPEKWQHDEVMNIHYVGGSKDGLFNAFQQMPDLLDTYEYFTIADDDFIMAASDLNKLFDTMVEYDLQIAQPSWSNKSYITFWNNLHNPAFKIRWMNFCEMNTVGIHRKVLRQILPLWEENPLAWYIDFFWANLSSNPRLQVAVIDDIQVTHSRPYNSGPLYKQNFPLEGPQRYSVLRMSRGIDRLNPEKLLFKEVITHCALLKNGKRVKGRFRLFPHLLRSWLKMSRQVSRRQFHENRTVRRHVRWAITHQLTGNLMLENTKLFIYGKANK